MDAVKQEIVTYCHKLYAHQFVAANDGNISVLLNNDTVLITPTGVSKGDMTEDMLITLDLDGKAVEGSVREGGLQPSSEARMHIECFQKREDIKAVVHAHPPFATALGATGYTESLSDEVLLPEILLTMGRIGIVPYCTPGSADLAQKVAEAIASHNGVLLKNHGALTVGKDMQEAYFRLESLELYCKVWLLATLTGKSSFLSSDETEKLLRATANGGKSI